MLRVHSSFRMTTHTLHDVFYTETITDMGESMSRTSADIESFGPLLRTLRKRLRLTQQQLAQAVGMHRHTVSRWEQGEVLPSGKAVVLELARKLHLDPQETRRLLDASLASPVPIWGVPL